MQTTANTRRPTKHERQRALRSVARALGVGQTFRVGGRFFFSLGDRWYLAVSADDAGRFRIEACYGTFPVATMWAFAQDQDRLASLVREIQSEVATLVA